MSNEVRIYTGLDDSPELPVSPVTGGFVIAGSVINFDQAFDLLDYLHREIYGSSVDDAISAAYDEGKRDGDTAEFDRGYDAGESEGWDNGYAVGKNEGYELADEGYNTGYNEGFSAGYEAGSEVAA